MDLTRNSTERLYRRLKAALRNNIHPRIEIDHSYGGLLADYPFNLRRVHRGCIRAGPFRLHHNSTRTGRGGIVVSGHARPSAVLITDCFPSVTEPPETMYAAARDSGFAIAGVDTAGMNPGHVRQVTGYPTNEAPGTIIVDQTSRYLYFVLPRGNPPVMTADMTGAEIQAMM